MPPEVSVRPVKLVDVPSAAEYGVYGVVINQTPLFTSKEKAEAVAALIQEAFNEEIELVKNHGI